MKSKIYSLTIIALFLFSIGAFAQCTITSGPTVTPNGLSISVTGTGTGASIPQYVYDWGDATSPGTSQTSTHTYAAAGTYTLCMYYADLSNSSCLDTSCTQVTVSATGIADPNAPSLNISASPNPFSSEININLSLNETQSVDMEVYDLTGKQVAVLKNGTMAAGNNVINWKPVGISEGIYFLQVKAGDTVLTKKIVYSGN
ncbi:MAG TPA: T9SS type A sorting domain-containing protein [Bacteroidia bacterium]|nr:T9SS type A sorting domain-containing protein [Bacteroidia bacterium]